MEGKVSTYNFRFDVIESVMELLVGKGHKFIDTLLSEATLPWIPQVRIPEYLASLMKLSEFSDRDIENTLCLAHNKNQGR